jgi:hypothetical protein
MDPCSPEMFPFRNQAIVQVIQIHSHRAKGPSRRGFALVVTLSLMILLAVISVGLLGLSAVSLRASSQGMEIAEARANARLALMLAIGELQKSMGPDQRISARAETLARHPAVGASVPGNSAKAWWVGASHSDPDQVIDRAGRPVVWLVSGLDPQGNPAQQLSQPLNDPVALFDKGSIDTTALTGGQQIEAGNVTIQNPKGQAAGGFAWFVDDNGMKAKLNASPDLRNDDGANGSDGVLPASYDPSILEGMDVIANATREQIQRLGSLRDLEFLGASENIARSKFFGYTAQSLGLLADVKNGGLKKDLSVAFDWQPAANSASNPVFDRLFPRTGSVPSHFIVADRDRLITSELSELNRDNGYINFAIFRDYYRLKDHLQTVNGVDCIWPTNILRNSLLAGNDPGVYQGDFAPHPKSSWDTVRMDRHGGLPYGEYPLGGNAALYRDNPILPILAFAQQNAWVTQQTPTQIRTHVQMFTSHYNAHNAGILISPSLPSGAGCRVQNYPQVKFTVSGTTLNDQAGLQSTLEVQAPQIQFLQPGRAQVFGFDRAIQSGQEDDGAAYSRNIARIVGESVYKDHAGTLTPESKLTAVFHLTNSNFVHGVSLLGSSNTAYEASQVFYAPFAGQTVFNEPRGIGTKKTVVTQGTGVNHVARNAFYLRSTREAGNAIRPLVDANIRAMWNNPRWDAPLGLTMLASHSETSSTAPPANLPMMATAANGDGFTYMGSDRDPSGYDRVVLFDVPRSDLVSLGQLQHAAAGRFSYEPTYIVGNSYANLRIPLDKVVGRVSDTAFCSPRGLPAAGTFNLYDASYIVNERLWDEYIFTTIPQSGSGPSLTPTYCESLLSRDDFLPNPRFIPYEPRGSSFSVGTLSDAGTGDGLTGKGSFFHNAGHLLVDGSFNVNSTSVDAWEAFLSATHRLPVGKLDADGKVNGFTEVKSVRFPRAASHLGTGMKTSGLDENYWIGFRELTQTEVRELATEIVAQIRERGPFLDLASFVNRKLENSEEGKSGPLQAALDNTVNRNLDSSFQAPASGHSNLPANSSQGSGFPGQLLQGDILQALSPYMTARSDTFTIRAYGEAKNPVTGAITATAYCEAVVQRFPDPVASPNAKPILEELARPSSVFGRKFSILSFRWLSPSEV